jgi:REP element-mobilizing transposase RayT
MNPIPLENGKYYHIYNRGNNGIDLFYEAENYNHFLRLYEKYIDPIAETFAWCLMKNHFHILVYIKETNEIDITKLEYSSTDKPKIISASKQFSNLFNAYTLAMNKRYNRTGSLFEKNFKRKVVSSENYFQKLIFYIHNNPVHHRFAEHIVEYPWTSYGTIISTKQTKLQRNRVIESFNDLENFKQYHSINQNLDEIEDLIIE